MYNTISGARDKAEVVHEERDLQLYRAQDIEECPAYGENEASPTVELECPAYGNLELH